MYTYCTLSFLPSMVVISASLPMVKEFVTFFPGVLDVMVKSLPFCWISITGLTSLAILMTSSGRAERNRSTKIWVSDLQSWQGIQINWLQTSHGLFPKSIACIKISDALGNATLLVWQKLTDGSQKLLVVLLDVNLPRSAEGHVCCKSSTQCEETFIPDLYLYSLSLIIHVLTVSLLFEQPRVHHLWGRASLNVQQLIRAYSLFF